MSFFDRVMINLGYFYMISVLLMIINSKNKSDFKKDDKYFNTIKYFVMSIVSSIVLAWFFSRK